MKFLVKRTKTPRTYKQIRRIDKRIAGAALITLFVTAIPLLSVCGISQLSRTLELRTPFISTPIIGLKNQGKKSRRPFSANLEHVPISTDLAVSILLRPVKYTQVELCPAERKNCEKATLAKLYKNEAKRENHKNFVDVMFKILYGLITSGLFALGTVSLSTFWRRKQTRLLDESKLKEARASHNQPQEI